MIKRIIEVSTSSYLHLKNDQLLIDRDNQLVAKIPIEDIGVLILESNGLTISQALIIACQKHNVAMIFCDEKHLPYSAILPISEGNNLHRKVLQQQLDITKPTKNRLWQQIIKQKINNQASVLKFFNKHYTPLISLAKQVVSNDKNHCEAVAAQFYWKNLFGRNFRRDINSSGINTILNYGYSIMRAAIARSICGAGLHPTLGLFHKNQYNALCLADDLIEPFRPWVDSLAYDLYLQNNKIELTKLIKIPFLNLLSKDISYQGKNMPLMVSLHYLIADLKRNYNKEIDKLHYPALNFESLLT